MVQNSKVKRLILGICLVVFSLIVGVICGIEITVLTQKDAPIIINKEDNEVEAILKDKWYSEIYYGKEIDQNVLIDQFIGALETSDEVIADPYTYLEHVEKAESSNKGKLGITLTNHYNYPVITNVEKLGASNGILKEGDIVVAVTSSTNKEYRVSDGNNTFYTVFSDALGLPGEKVTVEYYRLNKSTNKLEKKKSTLTLKSPSSIQTYVKYYKPDIADTMMVTISSFVDGSNGTASQLEEILKTYTAKNLIINLVDNLGGSLYSVLDVCDLLLPKEKLVCSLLNKKGEKTDYQTSKDTWYHFDNIVIFQNDSTASASEILISTLLYYYPDIVTQIGSKSYGKGIATTSSYVYDASYILHYTYAKWLRPDGSWIGMTDSKFTTDNGYQLGFDVKEENQVYKDKAYSMYTSMNTYLYYKETNFDYDGFTSDVVSTCNSVFFTIYNELYDKTIRDDGYFDSTCALEIGNYQALKGITRTNAMNEETFAYFVYDTYNLGPSFTSKLLDKAKGVING